MGLLDMLSGMSDQQRAGLSAFSSALMQPINSGRLLDSLGNGASAVMPAMNAFQDRQMQMQMQNAQLKHLSTQNDLQTAQTDLAKQKAAHDQRMQTILGNLFNPSQSMTSQPAPQPVPQPQVSAGDAMGAGASMGDVGPTLSNAARMTPAAPMQGNAAPLMPQPQAGDLMSRLTPSALAALTVAGYDKSKDLLEIAKYGNDPQKMEGGSQYRDRNTGKLTYVPKVDNGMTVDPNTGQVRALDGYANANAGIEGAKASAVAGAQFPFNVAQNRSQQTLGAQLDPVQVVDANGNKVYSTRAQVAGLGGGAGPANGAPPTGAIAGLNPITQQTKELANKQFIEKTFPDISHQGSEAQAQSNNIQALRNINFKTGFGSEQKAAVASFLSGLGISPKNATMYAAGAQSFQSIALETMATELRRDPGPKTEGDAKRALDMFAQLKNTPEANAFIMDFAQAKANMSMRKSAYHQEGYEQAVNTGNTTGLTRGWQKAQGSLWDDPILQKYAK